MCVYIFEMTQLDIIGFNMFGSIKVGRYPMIDMSEVKNLGVMR